MTDRNSKSVAKNRNRFPGREFNRVRGGREEGDKRNDGSTDRVTVLDSFFQTDLHRTQHDIYLTLIVFVHDDLV